MISFKKLKQLMRLAIVVPAIFTAVNANAVEQTCLDYWTVGPSGCNGTHVEEIKEPSPTIVIQQTNKEPAPVAAPQKTKEQTLQEKVDKFMENHGKPPVEWVEFHLEPTLDNAMRWVQKYNEMIERNLQLTIAWNQAKKIYEAAEQSGIEIPKLKDPLPEVPDFGVPLTKPQQEQLAFANAVATNSWGGDLQNKAQLGEMMDSVPLPPPAFSPESLAATSEQGSHRSASFFNEKKYKEETKNKKVDIKTNPFQRVESLDSDGTLPSHKISASNLPTGEPSTISISYYFSAECPYCAKFEPEFKAVMDELATSHPKLLDVTCVDMTPKEQTVANIYGKIDCAWRPLRDGEMEAYGVKHTPTLLINRNNGAAIERLSGYTDGESLKELLLRGLN